MLQVTMFVRPNGRKAVKTITKILPEDAAWFHEHNANVSMEDLGYETVIYAEIGLEIDGEPAEAIELSRGRSCEETFSALRKQCESMLLEVQQSQALNA